MKKWILGLFLVCIGMIITVSGLIFFTQSGLKISIAAAEKFLPGELTVDDSQGRLANQFELKGIRYSDDFGVVTLKQFSFGWLPMALLNRKVHVTSFRARDLILQPAAKEQEEGGDALSSLSLFAFPFAFDMEKGDIESITVLTDDGQQMEIASLKLSDLSAEGNRISAEHTAIQTDSMKIVATGHLLISEKPFASLAIQYTLHYQDSPSVAGEIMLKGTTEQLEYETHIFQPAVVAATGSLYDIVENPHWDVLLEGDALSLTQLDKTWPGITINGLQVSGKGDSSSYTFQVHSKASYETYRDIGVLAEMNGGEDVLQFTRVELGMQEMELQGNGTLSWGKELAWQADLKGQHIDPALFDSRWPGSIGFDAVLSGQAHDGKVKWGLGLEKMDGKIRDYPLSAAGDIAFDGSNISVKRLYVQSGDSVLNVTGNIEESLDMEFMLNSPGLEAVWPGLSGSMNVAGKLIGSMETPLMQLDMVGNGLQYNNIQLGQLAGSVKGEAHPEGSMAISLTADEVLVNGSGIDAIGLDLEGNLKEHRIKANLTASEINAAIRLEGRYSEQRWSGFIDKGSISSDKTGQWEVHGPAPLKLSFPGVDIQDLCLTGHEASRMCLNGQYSDELWQGSVTIESIPLSLFDALQYTFEEVEGLIFGAVFVEGKGKEITSSKLELSANGLVAQLVLGNDKKQRIAWKSCQIRTNTEDSHGRIELSGVLDDGSKISAQGTLTDFDIGSLAFQDIGFDGKIVFDIADLGLLNAISYPTVQSSGTLAGSIEMAGKLKKPELRGYVVLDQGKLILPEQGITIKDVTLQVDGLIDRLSITLKGASGNGMLSASGILPLKFEEDAPVRLRITGEDFEVFNSPEMRVNVSPELELSIGKEEKKLSGQVVITEALIAPRALKGIVKPSKDVVFVHEETTTDETSLPISIDITVTAGDKIKVRAFGLKSSIDGKLHIVSQPDKPVLFEGNLNISKGTYSIYGRQLDIVKGHLLYSGNQPDNPGIELRAENTASGVTTGIEVSGFLQEPQIGFYSTPAMEKDEIIRRLLMNTTLVGSSSEEGFLDSVTADTGLDPVTSAVVGLKESLYLDDIKIESGKESEDLSLVVGSWLTPKLYISYGQNLLKESGSFKTKYVLGHDFFLETETGTTDSGVDLKYEISR